VIVPVKGEEEGLTDNLAALAALDYPDYELIVVARAAEDVPPGVVPSRARVVYGGDGDPATGEKINNLLAAVDAARPESKVFAFTDSDGRVTARWLRALTGALAASDAGAATGYRWHLPEHGFWSHLRSAWNAVIAGSMGPVDARFAWGGAMAIRRETFLKIRVPEFWRGAVSDDYRLSAAVKAAGLRIAFVPAALVPSMDHTGAAEFFGWIRRQMLITRVYAPQLWRLALVAHLAYCGGMAASVTLWMSGDWRGAAALAIQLLPGMYKAGKRLHLAEAALPEHATWFRKNRRRHIALVPIATWAWLYGCLAAAGPKTVTWRGRRYHLGK
jgi:GT2 family glycosyltransferase